MIENRSFRVSAVLPVILFCPLLSLEVIRAATINAASCSTSDVQAAINSANSGDTVTVPAGTCSWTVRIPNTKGITLSGASEGATKITNPAALRVASNSATPTRITGFGFTGAGGNGTADIELAGSVSSAPYRIDHNTFTNSAGSWIFVAVSGNGAGLIDHNTFTGSGASEEIHNLGMGPSNYVGWTDDISPGGPDMVYLEDNTFTSSNPTFICSGTESFYGSRTVLRNNTFNFCQIDQHGTAGMIGARWWEVYNNNFYTPPGQNQCCYITMRGGSGVIWGNTSSGGNGTTGGIDLYEEDKGTWPLAYQVGSGINGDTNGHNSCPGVKLNSAPAYVWGNGTIPVNSQTPTTVVSKRDYFVSSIQPSSMNWQEKSGDTCSTTYAYKPFPYPYPLDSNNMPCPDCSRPASATKSAPAPAQLDIDRRPDHLR